MTIFVADSQLDSVMVVALAAAQTLSTTASIGDTLASIEFAFRIPESALPTRLVVRASPIICNEVIWQSVSPRDPFPQVRRMGPLVFVFPHEASFSATMRASEQWASFCAYFSFLHHFKLLKRGASEVADARLQ